MTLNRVRYSFKEFTKLYNKIKTLRHHTLLIINYEIMIVIIMKINVFLDQIFIFMMVIVKIEGIFDVKSI